MAPASRLGRQIQEVLGARSTEPATPLVADGGVVGRPVVPGDPFAALDDLMFVVEALCSRWPERPVFAATDLRL